MSIRYYNKALTLAELIIVMAIIAAMVSVAAPYAKNTNKNAIVLNEALNIQEVIYYAIDKSKSSNVAIRFVHSKSGKSYWLQKSDIQDEYQFDSMINSLGTAHHYDDAIKNIIIEGSETIESFDYITFDPRNPLPTGISLQLLTLSCWAELTIEGRNIKVLNDSY